MLSLIERETKGFNAASPSSPTTAASAKQTPSRPVQAAVCIIVISISLYISFFLLPAFSETDLVTDAPRSSRSSNKKTGGDKLKPSSNGDTASEEEARVSTTRQHGRSKSKNGHTASSRAVVSPLEPWGYNKHRNIPRWNAIRKSIKKDMIMLEKQQQHYQHQRQQQDGNNHADTTSSSSSRRHRFVLVDYGSDQGFFAISAAHAFKNDGIFVVSVEMGGVGGEIWKKKDKISEGSNDVLSIQEKMVAKYLVADAAAASASSSSSSAVSNTKDDPVPPPPSFMICQTKISPKMFADLADKNERHRYQFVLSVFHWFDLPTRKDFEEALVTLFKNARSTFIELPTIGDRSSLIRKQVGWSNFEKWYDGRSDIKEIILDAAKNQKFPVRVEKIVSVPWLKWTRDMFRVDWDIEADANNHESEKLKFSCSTRREIYGCNTKREKLQECISGVF